MDKNNIFIIICLFLFIGLINLIIEKNNRVKKPILNIIDDFNSIIDRTNDSEFNYIVNKIKRNTKSSYSNIILITSKIIVSRNTFSYVNNRSIYTIETRFKQTIETIESIRKYIPDVCIFLLDDSNFEKGFIYMHTKLNDVCDIFINPINNKELHHYTNVNKYKSIAEGYQIIYFLDILNQLDIKYDRFFKISGRYFINKTFDYNNYLTDDITFSKKMDVDIIYYNTSFYMIPYSKFKLYRNAYNILYKNKDKEHIIENNIELLLPTFIQFENIKLITNMGITQRIAVWNEISNI
jgi:hypothetical protein